MYRLLTDFRFSAGADRRALRYGGGGGGVRASVTLCDRGRGVTIGQKKALRNRWTAPVGNLRLDSGRLFGLETFRVFWLLGLVLRLGLRDLRLDLRLGLLGVDLGLDVRDGRPQIRTKSNIGRFDSTVAGKGETVSRKLSSPSYNCIVTMGCFSYVVSVASASAELLTIRFSLGNMIKRINPAGGLRRTVMAASHNDET